VLTSGFYNRALGDNELMEPSTGNVMPSVA
jgi:hypothetical protein